MVINKFTIIFFINKLIKRLTLNIKYELEQIRWLSKYLNINLIC